MDNPIYVPLKVAVPTEVRQDWDIISKNLSELSRWISRTFAVDITDYLSKNTTLYLGSSEPEGEDAGKLWIKTTSPPALGIPFNGQYTMLYPFPPSCPVLWTNGESELPTYLRKLSETELERYSLTDPSGDDYFYVILEP